MVLFLSFWLVTIAGEIRAAEPGLSPDLTTLVPETSAIHRAVRSIALLRCMTPACLSVITLQRIFEIIGESEATTMGVPRELNANQPYVEEKWLHRIFLDHPDRFGPMCALLTNLASRYGRPGARQGVDEELYVGVEIVDLASRMDGYGPPQCLPAVLAAMPHTAEADTAIGNQRIGCENEPVARDPCARINR